uniref:Glycosyltransferase 2-like domain-containing protein n=1 Tax=viral metagenome TaxID=1070528 RepID=A0A6C0HVR9_9ZZZZ
MPPSPPVSLITISQLKRSACLLNLYELIKLQKYKNIIEWIIVEGSPLQEDAHKNKEKVEKLINSQSESMKIIYVEYSGPNKLSDLRNIGNNKCIGDIIVCMDDDDYYPPERVSHAVARLVASSKLIAGCSDIYMYEYLLKKLYKFNKFSENHSTNNSMAFKKEYLKTHSHQAGLSSGEEASFTNGFSEPMVQLSAHKCIILSSHDGNTYNKRELCVSSSAGKNKFLREIVDKSVEDYIPIDIFERMKTLF